MGAQRLAGKIALVTGGASGIGAATVARLAEEGAIAIAADLNPLAGDDRALRMDVADPASVEAGFATLLDRHGRIDAMVHCAGVARTLSFLDTSLEEFDRILGINLRGTFIVGQAAVRAMLAAGGGSIVNIASVSGMIGNGRRSAYGTSKAAMIHLTKVMAVEFATRGIRVNAIAPGPISTPLVDAFYTDANRREWTDRVPMARFGTTAEIAAVAAFLCSADASYVTGQVVAADGGFVIAGVHDETT